MPQRVIVTLPTPWSHAGQTLGRIDAKQTLDRTDPGGSGGQQELDTGVGV